MRNKFLGTGDSGYRPLRKLAVIAAGLRYAVLHDFSVMYKVVLSMLILALAVWLRDWVDAATILLATGLMVAAELFNTAIEALCDFVETRHLINVIHRLCWALRQAQGEPFHHQG